MRIGSLAIRPATPRAEAGINLLKLLVMFGVDRAGVCDWRPTSEL